MPMHSRYLLIILSCFSISSNISDCPLSRRGLFEDKLVIVFLAKNNRFAFIRFLCKAIVSCSRIEKAYES
jgi:hypothetical protein